jgi:ferredoxin-NADP reductase
VTERGHSPTRGSRWRVATVVSIHPETPTAKTFRLRLSSPSGHLAGQHYIIRLTAPDGYTASRSYSVASAPDNSPEIDLTVERLPEGEVSTFLHDDVVPGDELEVRGPIGGWFVWAGDTPALLIGGGSGVVPLMAMLRLARHDHASDLVRLVVSVRAPEDLYYSEELPGPETTVVYTRRAPVDNTRGVGRLTRADIPSLPDGGLAYICGSESFAEAAADLVLASGTAVERIRIEKFGPSG